jgi:hypothetical protein
LYRDCSQGHSRTNLLVNIIVTVLVQWSIHHCTPVSREPIII